MVRQAPLAGEVEMSDRRLYDISRFSGRRGFKDGHGWTGARFERAPDVVDIFEGVLKHAKLQGYLDRLSEGLMLTEQ